MTEKTEISPTEKLLTLIEQSLFLEPEVKFDLLEAVKANPDGDYSHLLELLEKGDLIQGKMFEKLMEKNPNFPQELKQAKYRALKKAYSTGESAEGDRVEKKMEENLKNIS